MTDKLRQDFKLINKEFKKFSLQCRIDVSFALQKTYFEFQEKLNKMHIQKQGYSISEYQRKLYKQKMLKKDILNEYHQNIKNASKQLLKEEQRIYEKSKKDNDNDLETKLIPCRVYVDNKEILYNKFETQCVNISKTGCILFADGIIQEFFEKDKTCKIEIEKEQQNQDENSEIQNNFEFIDTKINQQEFKSIFQIKRVLKINNFDFFLILMSSLIVLQIDKLGMKQLSIQVEESQANQCQTKNFNQKPSVARDAKQQKQEKIQQKKDKTTHRKKTIRKKSQKIQIKDICQSQLKKFQFNVPDLLNFLKTTNQNEKFNGELYEKLTSLDQNFVNFYLQNKFEKTCLKKRRISKIKEAKEIFEYLENAEFKKTTQQQLQFLIKHSFKSMRIKLIKNKLLNHHFNHQIFYEYYFKETAAKLNLDIGIFYDPRNTKTLQPKYKTYGKRYVLNLLNSEKFKWALFEFLSNEINDYYSQIALNRFELTLKQIQKRINKTLSQNQFSNLLEAEECVNQLMKRQIVNNKQSKLPWMKNEINQAIEVFAKMIGHHQFCEIHKKYSPIFASMIKVDN